MNDNIDLTGIIAALQNSVQAINSLNQTLNNLLPNGAYVPFSQSDASASSNTLYYSTDTNVLSYKDPSSVVHLLY